MYYKEHDFTLYVRSAHDKAKNDNSYYYMIYFHCPEQWTFMSILVLFGIVRLPCTCEKKRMKK